MARRSDTDPPNLAQSRARASLGAICERIESGSSIVSACALEGIPRRTFYWMLEHDAEAAVAVERARAKAAERDEIELRTLIADEKKTASVMLHLMERLYPHIYAPPKQRIEQDVHVTQGVEEMSDEEILSEAERIVAEQRRLAADVVDAEEWSDDD